MTKGIVEKKDVKTEFYAVQNLVSILDRRVEMAQKGSFKEPYDKNEEAIKKGFSSWQETIDRSLENDPLAIEFMIATYEKELVYYGDELNVVD